MRFAALILLLTPIAGLAQVTAATGDTRPITEPSALLNSPTICAQVPATKWMMVPPGGQRVNIDPNNITATNPGVLNQTTPGGTDYQPSSSSVSFVSAETTDNAALLSAMNSCPAGQAVELTQGASGQNAFVLAPINIKNSSGQGIYILGDAGIAVNASRSPADYGGGTCGTVSTSATTSCGTHWISSSSTSGAGIVGYANWYGRAWDKFTTGATMQSFYYQRLLTYCTLHGGTKNGSPTCPSPLPACTASGNDCRAYGPNGLNIVSATNFTVYKMTLRDSGNFLFNWQQGNGLTAWDVKLFAPFEVSNTDGWDSESSTNGTFTHGYLSNGDNLVAPKATQSTASNLTFSDSQTGAGIGVAVGTDITKNITNFLATGIIQKGNLNNSAQQTGAEITCGSHSGTVNQVTFQNFCQQNETIALQVIANNSSCKYSNILFQNINDLSSGAYNFQGLSGSLIGMQLNNVQTSGTPSGSSQYANIYRGPNEVTTAINTQLGCGSNGVTCTGSPSSSTAYPCLSSYWQALTGELNIQLPSGPNNNQTVSSAGPFTLQAVLQPTTEISTKESAPLTASVNFYDNGTLLGSSPLTGDGTYAAYSVASISSGTHNYTAKYPGDSNYSAFQFGSVTATNGSPSTPVVLTIGGQVVFSGTIPKVQ